MLLGVSLAPVILGRPNPADPDADTNEKRYTNDEYENRLLPSQFILLSIV